MGKLEFTILMPCLNEEKSIGFCINEAKEYIEKNSLSAEILIADNKSSDSSREIAESLGARVVICEDEGYGNTLRKGIKEAKGKYIIMGDSDGSYDFSQLDSFCEKLREGYDLVMGNRFTGKIEKGAMPFLHKIGVPALSLLGRLRYGVKTGDFHSGLRGFLREAAMEMEFKATGMEFATEIIGKFAEKNKKMCEVPINLRCDRREGKSHIRTFRDGLRHVFLILNK